MRIAILLLGIVFIITGIYSFMADQSSSEKAHACQVNGGAYVKTFNGYACIKAQVIDRL